MKKRLKFYERCYILLKRVPKGKVVTYKSIAKKFKTKSYRAVGNAMNKNHHKDVPCHRVINSNGNVGGFARGATIKIKLLKSEGVNIKDNKIDLKEYLYPL